MNIQQFCFEKKRNQLKQTRYIDKQKAIWKQKILENSQYLLQYISFNES